MRRRIHTVLLADLVGVARGMVAGVEVEVEDTGGGVEGGRWLLPRSRLPFCLLFPGFGSFA
jgi:hypothetical protein